MATAEIGRIIIRLVGDNSEYLHMLNESHRLTQSTMGSIISLAQQATAALSIPIAALALGSVKAFSAFDKGMVESQSIMMDLTQSQRKEMRDLALSVSSTLAQAPDKLAKSYFYLASAGFSAEQSMALLPAVARFAQAGLFNLEKATTLAADAQAALGLRSADPVQNMQNLIKVTDVLSQANILVNGNVLELSKSMTRQAGDIARQYGKSIEETTATLAAFHQQGIKAELAGTSFSRAIRFLAQTAITNARAHRVLGLEVFDATGKMRNMADIVENLEKILGPMSHELRQATLSALGFKAYTQTAILPLIGLSSQIRKFETQLRSAGGATQRISDENMKAFANQMQVLKNHVTIVAIEIGEVLAPYLERLAGSLREATIWWRALDEGTKKSIVMIGAVTAVVAPLIVLLGLVGPLLMKGLAIVAVLFSPVGLVLGLLGAGIYTFIQQMGGVAPAWQAVQDRIQGFYNWALPVFNMIAAASSSIWANISGAAGRAWDWITDRISRFSDWFAGLWGEKGGAFQQTISWMIQQVENFVSFSTPLLEKLFAFLGDALDGFGEAFAGFVEWAGPIWDAFTGLLAGTWEAAWSVIGSIIEFTADMFSGIMQGIAFMWNGLCELITDVFEAVGVDIKAVWDGIRDAIVMTLLTGEFVIRNFGAICSYTWLFIRLGFVQMANAIAFFFTDTIPAALSWFSRNWYKVFTDMFRLGAHVFSQLMLNFVRVIQNIGALMKGKVKWTDLWRPLTEGFESSVERLVLPERTEGALESRLRQRLEAEGALLEQSFEDFVNERLNRGKSPEEIIEEAMTERLAPGAPATRQLANQAGAAGEGVGKAFVDSANKEMHKFDAVLSRSAEAITRLESYKEHLAGGEAGSNITNRGERAARDARRIVDEVSRNAPGRGGRFSDKADQFLEQIKDILSEISGRPRTEFADLEL